MNPIRFILGVFAAAAIAPAAVQAQKVIFTAEIDATQEVPPTASPARGEAVLTYDLESNTFDLDVRLRHFTETLNASHIHQQVAGVNGPVVVNLGGEAAYVRHGDRLRLRLRDVPYSGDPAELLTGGAYLNFHTARFPAGAVRGQLLPHSAHFLAHLTGRQEVPANDSKAQGLARVRYDFLTDTVDVHILVANFRNTLVASHIHQAAPGVNGPVVTNLGGAAAYSRRGHTYHGRFAGLPYGGDLAQLLAGNAYINVHSDVLPGGEIRGQLKLVVPCRR